MKQLELRFYTRKEIAEITGHNINDSKHFKRNVETTLSKWGYGTDVVKNGFAITHIPTTDEERLREILIRQFHVDIQVDMLSFSLFVTAFTDIKGFDCMPWSEREKEYYKYSGKFYHQRTLSNWCSQLLDQNIMIKGSAGSYWRTDIDGHRKIRTMVTQEEAQNYFNRRSQLVKEKTEEYICAGMKYDKAQKAAWRYTYDLLWTEFNCCYYSCKTFHFSAFNEQGVLAEVYELTRLISGKNDGDDNTCQS